VSQDRDPAVDHDPAEQLLAEVVALPAAEQKIAFERLLVRHPELAIELRTRFALFQRLAALAPGEGDGAARLQRFGEYELVRELGRGGMGIVYLARQRRGEQERLVALKVVLDRGAFSTQARERLRREGAAAFRLDHPGICQGIDVGEVEGTPYLTMRYVPGSTLAEHIGQARTKGGPLALPTEATSEHGPTTSSAGVGLGGSRARAAVALVEQVARALHVAHEAGFVHRDVKPGNIMVTPDGQAVLLDFGLVRDEASEQGLTLTGQPIGTPAYMSPEQIEPRGRRIDRTTDVYSLGVTLYEALALRQPFEGRTREALFRDILSRRVDDLRRFAPFVSRDLRVVVATAMDPEPQRRYATALDFAEDLRRARTAQPIIARPASAGRRLQLWCKRNPLASAVLALLLVAVALNVGFAVSARRHAVEAEELRARAMEDFASARNAVSELVALASTHLSDVPWLEPVRRELFERALAFHRGFLTRAGATPDLRRDIAITKVECAGVLSHLGDAKAAAAMLAEAVPELEALAPEGGTDVLPWLARAQLTSAQVAQMRGDTTSAASAFRFAIDTLQGIARSRPLTVWEAVTLSTGLRNLAEGLQDRGEFAEADTWIAVAMAIPEIAEPSFTLERARLLGQRARLRRQQQDLEAAAADLRTAELALRGLMVGHAFDRDVRSSLAVNRMSLGVLLASRDQGKEAAAAYAEARSLLEGLVATFPGAASDRGNLATVLGAEASLLLRNGEGTDTKQLQRAVELMEGMVEQDPGNVAYQERLAQTRYRLAQAVRRVDAPLAAEQYRAALVALEQCLERNPEDGSARDLAWRSANSLGAMFAMTAHDEEAREAWTRARLHGTELLRRAPDDVRWRRSQATLLYNVGTLSCETGDLSTAADQLQEALQLDARIVTDLSTDLRARADYHKHLLRAAQVADLRGQDVAVAWQQANAAVTTASTEVRHRLEQNGDACLDLACIARGFGATAIEAGDSVAGGAALDRAERLLVGLAANVASDVERVLLQIAQVHRWRIEGKVEAATAAGRSLLPLANALAERLPQSRLHTARVRAVLPQVEALAGQGEDGTAAAALLALRKALGEAR
jgi:eukaryotic-like serine/threonine-protein kinase